MIKKFKCLLTMIMAAVLLVTSCQIAMAEEDLSEDNLQIEYGVLEVSDISEDTEHLDESEISSDMIQEEAASEEAALEEEQTEEAGEEASEEISENETEETISEEETGSEKIEIEILPENPEEIPSESEETTSAPEKIPSESTEETEKQEETSDDEIVEDPEDIELEAGMDLHDHGQIITDPAVPATLFKTGLTAGAHCSQCNEVIRAQEVVPMKNLSRIIGKGSRGEDVREIQQVLYDLGYLKVNPDGIFGSYTEAALKLFQQVNGCSCPDGLFGNWSLTVMRGKPVAYTGQDKPAQAIQPGDVYSVQDRLYGMGYLTVAYDGYFGSYTVAALKKFQIINGLDVTGKIDDATLSLLNNGNSLRFRTVSIGTSGKDVFNIQTALKNLGFLKVTPDGIFGNNTDKAVRLFQEQNYLPVDGIFGKMSLEAILTSENYQKVDEPTFDNSVLLLGDSGERVKEVQQYLYDLNFLQSEPDGAFGNNTLLAVKAFQVYNNLEITGEVDSRMMGMLESGICMGFRTLSNGMTGQDVYILQTLLNDLGYLNVYPPTSYFGGLTEEAVNRFQLDNGVVNPDGVFGPWCLRVAIKYFEETIGGSGGPDYDEPTYDMTLGEQIVAYARQWVGVTPYVTAYERMDEFGNITNSLITGTDCSGFTMLIYGHFGIYLPGASMMYQDDVGPKVEYEDIRPGDIVVYRYGEHVAIYAGKDQYGNDMIIHCSTPEAGTVYGIMFYQNPTAYIRVTE